MVIYGEFGKRLSEKLINNREIIRDLDGRWVYSPQRHTGVSDAYELRFIADLLDELNKDYDGEPQEYL